MRPRNSHTPEQFWGRVAKTGDCWLWTGYCLPRGYGRVRWHGKLAYAHRIAWLLTHGELADDLLICHRCDNPPCVRPDHLFLGTPADNVRDREAKGQGVHPAKLTAEQVVTIRERRATGMPLKALAREMGVAFQTIGQIVTGAARQQVGGPRTLRKMIIITDDSGWPRPRPVPPPPPPTPKPPAPGPAPTGRP